MLLHARPPRQRVHRHGLVGHQLRYVRFAGRSVCRRAGAYLQLGKDYYHFDATRHQLLGERTGQRYRLGDRVQVRVVKVDMESTKIDFVLDGIIEKPDREGTDHGKAAKPARKTAKGKQRHG